MKERHKKPSRFARHKGLRNIIEKRYAFIRGRLNQTYSGVSTAKRSTHLDLEFIKRLDGIPGRIPVSWQKSSRRHAAVAFHGKGERRIRIIRRRRFMHGPVCAHRGPAAVPVT